MHPIISERSQILLEFCTDDNWFPEIFTTLYILFFNLAQSSFPFLKRVLFLLIQTSFTILVIPACKIALHCLSMMLYTADKKKKIIVNLHTRTKPSPKLEANSQQRKDIMKFPQKWQ